MAALSAVDKAHRSAWHYTLEAAEQRTVGVRQATIEEIWVPAGCGPGPVEAQCSPIRPSKVGVSVIRCGYDHSARIGPI
jgi:hypothetical protein